MPVRPVVRLSETDQAAGGNLMTPKVSGLCVAAVFALTAGGAAQQPGTGGPARNDGVTTPNDFEQSTSKQAAQTLSLTGCVDRANDGTFQLTHARPSPPTSTGTPGTAGRPDSPTGTSGTAGSSPAADRNKAGSTWILKSATDLAPHVGHSVEITGRKSSPDSSPDANDATTTAPATTATGARIQKPGEDAQSVDVQSVRMISGSCP
jgi:hypothetical protein